MEANFVSDWRFLHTICFIKLTYNDKRLVIYVEIISLPKTMASKASAPLPKHQNRASYQNPIKKSALILNHFYSRLNQNICECLYCPVPCKKSNKTINDLKSINEAVAIKE